MCGAGAAGSALDGVAVAVEAAMYTAVRLRDYEDILDPVDVHSLIALIAYLPVPA